VNETLTHSETLKPYFIGKPEKQKRHWSLHFDSCFSCGTRQFRHAARGLCTHCYKIENRALNQARKEFLRQLQPPKKKVNLEWQHRARYDYRKLGLTPEESLNYWPFDQKPSVFEWWQLVEVSE